MWNAAVRTARRAAGRRLGRLALFGAILVAAFALAALPGARPPVAPTGPYPVRQQSFAWQDGIGRASAIHVWYPAAPDAAGALPVLLFSPGFGQTPTSYAALLADVASHGYAVLAVPHRYEEPFGWVTHVGPLAADLVAALDHAARAHQAGDPFFSRLDLRRVGAFGHSFGGAIAAEACIRDPRIRAGMDLDGSVFGQAVERGTPCPFFLMMAALPWTERFRREPPRFLPDRDQGYLHEEALFARTPTAYWLTVRRLDHMSFADAAFAPTAVARVAERVGVRLDATRVHELTVRYVRAFFGRYLSGAPTTGELERSPYPYATLRARTPADPPRPSAASPPASARSAAPESPHATP